MTKQREGGAYGVVLVHPVAGWEEYQPSEAQVFGADWYMASVVKLLFLY